MKTFEVTHIEDMGDYSDFYSHGTIEAENLDLAIKEFKDNWLEEDYNRDNITVINSDSDYELLEIQMDYFMDGNMLNDKEIEELEKKYDMDISDMIDNFDLDFDIGFVSHQYEIKEIDA